MAYETTDQLIAEVADHWNKKKDTVFYQLLDSYNSLLEKISDENEKIADWRSIDKAKGTTLDLIGQDYKAYRISDDDETFRFIIFLHILISRAQGTIPSMVKILGTALDAKPEQFKVYKTGLRHIGIVIPFENLPNVQMEKFIIKNIQNLLAMGYWIDEIKFLYEEKQTWYIGATTQDREHEINSLASNWWKGEKVESYNHWYFGTDLQTTDRCTINLASSWCSGEKENTSTGIYIATKMLIHENLELNSI